MTYTELRSRADRVSRMIMERWRETMHAAGLEATGTAEHNAWLSYQDGRPWSEVNYSLLRKARRLTQLSYLPMRLVDAWSKRQQLARRDMREWI